jgi:DNA-binding PadR family transcriptional regulator
LGPGSGYDIKKLVSRLLSHFWSESYGQIYPILKQLSAEGLAVRKVQRQRGKPDRQIYTITRKGVEVLNDWLREPTQIQVPRNETLLRISLGQMSSPEETLAQVERYRDHHLQNLQACSELEAAIREEFQAAPQLPFWLLTVSHEKHVSRAAIRWCDEARKVLQTEGAGAPIAEKNVSV